MDLEGLWSILQEEGLTMTGRHEPQPVLYPHQRRLADAFLDHDFSDLEQRVVIYKGRSVGRSECLAPSLQQISKEKWAALTYVFDDPFTSSALYDEIKPYLAPPKNKPWYQKFDKKRRF